MSHCTQPPWARATFVCAATAATSASSLTPRERAIWIDRELFDDDGLVVAGVEEDERPQRHADVVHQHGDGAAVGRPGARRDRLREIRELRELGTAGERELPELVVPDE